MPTKPTPLAPHDPQAVLRAALKEALKNMTTPAILRVAENASTSGVPGKMMSERALRKFISGETKALSMEHYNLLAGAWLHTPFGRALRSPDPAKLPAFDQLTRLLADGNLSRPANLAVTGNYFMYHGSYLNERWYVVRVITVEALDDQILTVTDIINDTRTVKRGRREASGVMIFVQGRPQILFYARENKSGLSLIIGSQIGTEDSGHVATLERFYGSLMVMTDRGEVACRPCLLIREPDSNTAAMLEESGIFELGDLAATERRKHVTAFNELADLMRNNKPFADPMLGYRSLSPSVETGQQASRVSELDEVQRSAIANAPIAAECQSFDDEVP